MDRDEFLRLLSRDLDDVAGPDERERLERARRAAPDLDRLAREIAGISDVLRTLPADPVPEGLAERVADRALAPRPSGLLLFARMHRMASIAAALLVMVSLGGLVGWIASPDPGDVVADPTNDAHQEAEESRYWQELGAGDATIRRILDLKREARAERKGLEETLSGAELARALADHDEALRRAVYAALEPEVRARWCAENGLDPRGLEIGGHPAPGR